MRQLCPRTAVRCLPLRVAAAISASLICCLVGLPPGVGVAAEADRFDLETSDGVTLAIWYYPKPEDAKPLATVILVHDFEASHKDLEPLAVALQRSGCTVAVPDLRGHGASTEQAGRDKPLDVRQFRKTDFELIAAGAGGRLRAQSAVRGDLETVHGFLTARGDIDDSGDRPLAVVGCGAGATLAAFWTGADWAWPPLASGPQGQHVRALVMVSPQWTTKGLPMQPALASEAIKHEVPVMVVAGRDDGNAVRLFEQLKRYRPREWFDQRAGAEFTKAKEVEKPGDATLFFMQLDTNLAGDKLARNEDAGVAGRIKTFLDIALKATAAR